MKKVLLALSIVFILLTFVGAGYVLYSEGNVNAGYAVIPMIISIAFITLYRKKIKENKEK